LQLAYEYFLLVLPFGGNCWKLCSSKNSRKNHKDYKWVCGNLPQCQTDGLNSFSTSAKQTVLLHINQQTILTPNEIANSTYMYSAHDRGKR
jgi:hypothetical protein